METEGVSYFLREGLVYLGCKRDDDKVSLELMLITTKTRRCAEYLK